MTDRSWIIHCSLAFVFVLNWTAAKHMDETAKGQDLMSVNAADRPLCGVELPCFENALIIGDIQDGDDGISIVCDSGYAFSDGSTVKHIHCERVIDEKGRVIKQFSKIVGGCELVLCPVDNIENSLMIGNGTHGNALDDTQLVMCEDGHAFPDGKSFMERSCVERVTHDEENSFRHGEWEPRLQNCVPK